MDNLDKAQEISKKIIWTLYQLSVAAKTSNEPVLVSYLNQILSQFKSLEQLPLDTSIPPELLSFIDTDKNPMEFFKPMLKDLVLADQKSNGRSKALTDLLTELRQHLQ